MSTTSHTKYRFTIIRPNKTRRSFDIKCDRVPMGDRRTQITISKISRFSTQAEALQSVNEQLKASVLTVSQAEIAVKEIKSKLEFQVQSKASMRRRANIAQANLNIFEAYWTKHYENNRQIIDKKRVRDQFHYALSILGTDVFLASVDAKELQTIWDKKLKGSAHRRYGIAIRALLRFIGRDVDLRLDGNDSPRVEYITIEELDQLVNNCGDPVLVDCLSTLFGTGVRIGELFALHPRSIKRDIAVFVEYQIDPRNKKRDIKNKRKHDALIIKKCLPAIKRWCSLDFKSKLVLRHTIWPKLEELSLRVLNRKVTPHHFRHSYAIHLLDCGVPLDRVAQFLGDTLDVTQRHYTGFVVTDYALTEMSKLVK